jgi:hypothetical protein
VAWALNNSQTGKLTGTAASLSTAAFANALHNTSTIIVAIGDGEAGNSYYTISDTAGNSYGDVGEGIVMVRYNIWSQVFYALNTHTTASNIVTVTPSSGTLSYARIIAAEFTGGKRLQAGVNPVDRHSSLGNQVAGASGANNMVGPSVKTSYDGELVFAWFPCYNATAFTAGTSPNAFTDIGAGVGGESEYFVQATAGAIAPTAGGNLSSDAYAVIWAAFRLFVDSPTQSGHFQFEGGTGNISLEGTAGALALG